MSEDVMAKPSTFWEGFDSEIADVPGEPGSLRVRIDPKVDEDVPGAPGETAAAASGGLGSRAPGRGAAGRPLHPARAGPPWPRAGRLRTAGRRPGTDASAVTAEPWTRPPRRPLAEPRPRVLLASGAAAPHPPGVAGLGDGAHLTKPVDVATLDETIGPVACGCAVGCRPTFLRASPDLGGPVLH